MVVSERARSGYFGTAEVGLSGAKFDDLMPSECELDASHPPVVSSEKTPVDDKSLSAEVQTASSFIDYAANLRRVQANPEFVHASKSIMPAPDRAIQDCPVDIKEKNNDKGPDLGSPLRIIQAWSEKIAPRSMSSSDDLKRNNIEEVSREASRVSRPSTKGGMNAASDEISTAIASHGSNERELTSPFHIIEAWTQTSSEPPMSAKLPKPTNLKKNLHSSKNAVEAVFEQKVAVVRPTNSSAFAPWNSSVEGNKEDEISLIDEIPKKNKKNIMELGRKHIVNRSLPRPEVASKEKSSDEPVHAGTATSTDSSKRMDGSDVRTFNPGPLSFPKADDLVNRKSFRSKGGSTKEQRAADEPLSHLH